MGKIIAHYKLPATQQSAIEIRRFGKYRTKHLVPKAWNKFGYTN